MQRFVMPPKIVYASTDQSHFIATANGEDEAQFTLSFSSKKPGVTIVGFAFVAYETDSSDAVNSEFKVDKRKIN